VTSDGGVPVGKCDTIRAKCEDFKTSEKDACIASNSATEGGIKTEKPKYFFSPFILYIYLFIYLIIYLFIYLYIYLYMDFILFFFFYYYY
jgi:hypothetical protein